VKLVKDKREKEQKWGWQQKVRHWGKESAKRNAGKEKPQIVLQFGESWQPQWAIRHDIVPRVNPRHGGCSGALGAGRDGSNCIIGLRFSFGAIKGFGTR
jgi:hypothetical protein